MFKATFGDAIKGTRVTDVLARTNDTPATWSLNLKLAEPLAETIYAGLLDLVNESSSEDYSHFHTEIFSNNSPLLDQTAQLLRRIDLNGLIYSIPGRGTRNSFILFRARTPPSRKNSTSAEEEVLAGQIDKIFLHARRLRNGKTKNRALPSRQSLQVSLTESRSTRPMGEASRLERQDVLQQIFAAASCHFSTSHCISCCGVYIHPRGGWTGVHGNQKP